MHSHGHHGHDHGHGGTDTRKALSWALGLNAGFLVIEAGVGWWADSLALLSDAAHMLSDVGALVLALASAQLARRRPNIKMTFGLQRAETLGAFINGLTLLLASGWIIWEATKRLTEGPPDVAGMPVLIVGSIGLAINLGSAWFLYRSDRDNLNIRAALMHMLADALGSVGAVVAAILVMTGVDAADAVVSLFIAALILWGTWSVLRDSGRVLMQLPPAGLDVRKVQRRLAALDGVAQVHDLHAWTLDGQATIMTAHLVAAEGTDSEGLRRSALEALEHDFSITHATLQVEQPANPCLSNGCGAEDEVSDVAL